ncbi:SDR family oxidoreductase [Arachidicoccus ginsenosidivorans]|nr:SDR family oxidoreductase [Arachidicoccus ginsenosidivorans]
MRNFIENPLTMKRVLIAGATGYLGHFTAIAFKNAGYYTKLLVRNPQKLKTYPVYANEVVQAEITQPETLIDICAGIDIVFTSVGITRQKDGLSYHDVDFQGNMNLLEEAKKAGVSMFIYISVFNGQAMQDLAICREKERFVRELQSSGLPYRVIRPTGYFSDMNDYYIMAKKGRVYIFGSGNAHINPISGKDLAAFCLTAIEKPETAPEVGGPKAYTHNEIATLAFQSLNKPAKITHIPAWLCKVVIFLMRKLTSSKTYGPFEFVATMLTKEMVAPFYGSDDLLEYFKSLKSTGKSSPTK